jgi:hypothetical protein
MDLGFSGMKRYVANLKPRELLNVFSGGEGQEYWSDSGRTKFSENSVQKRIKVNDSYQGGRFSLMILE